MSNKLLNILLTAFIIICPTASYLLNYSSCYSLDLRQNAFYFYLLLIAVFMLFFLFICCYGNAFSRPVFVKNSFMLLTIIFLPLFCHYVAKHYFYKVYLSPLIYILIFLCLIIGFIRLPSKSNTTPKHTLNIISDFLSDIFPFLYYFYKLPTLTYQDMTDTAFLFVIAVIALSGSAYLIILSHRDHCKNYENILKVYYISAGIISPLLVFYVFHNFLFNTYIIAIAIIVIVVPIINRLINKKIKKGE